MITTPRAFALATSQTPHRCRLAKIVNRHHIFWTRRCSFLGRTESPLLARRPPFDDTNHRAVTNLRRLRDLSSRSVCDGVRERRPVFHISHTSLRALASSGLSILSTRRSRCVPNTIDYGERRFELEAEVERTLLAAFEFVPIALEGASGIRRMGSLSNPVFKISFYFRVGRRKKYISPIEKRKLMEKTGLDNDGEKLT